MLLNYLHIFLLNIFSVFNTLYLHNWHWILASSIYNIGVILTTFKYRGSTAAVLVVYHLFSLYKMFWKKVCKLSEIGRYLKQLYYHSIELACIHIKNTYQWKLQICLSRYNLLVDTRLKGLKATKEVIRKPNQLKHF